MLDYLNSVKRFAHWFEHISQAKSTTQLNRAIVFGLGRDWEPLVLALSKDIPTMRIDELCALLLNSEAHRSYMDSTKLAPPLSGILGAAFA